MASGTVIFERKDSRLGTDTEENVSVADDMWNDEVLIENYDEVANAVKCQVAARMMSRGEQCLENGVEQFLVNGVEQLLENSAGCALPSKKSKKKKSTKGKVQWEVGAPCRAVFSEDGCEYEAIVQSINHKTGTCVVKYIGYENEEEIPAADLQPSRGPTARQYQIQQALENSESDNITETDAEDVECNIDSIDDISSGAGSWVPQPDFISYSSRREPYPRQRLHHSQNPVNIPIPPPPPPHLTSQFPDEDSEALSAMLLSWYMSGFHTGYYQGLKEAKKIRRIQNQPTAPSRKK